jgi:carbonic anhydrase
MIANQEIRMRLHPFAALAGLYLLGLGACSDQKTKPEAHANESKAPESQALSGTLDQWGYLGDEGPENWGRLGGQNTICSTGKRQSPIDIAGGKRAQSSKLVLDYASSNATLQNNGHAMVVTPEKSGGVRVDGVFYKLLQFHFHAPSEHAIDGHRMAFETHFVHQNQNGDYLVIAVLSEIGAADPMLAPIFAYLPRDPGGPVILPDLLINPRDLMPATEAFYAYAGSLTTPPCKEGVTWIIFNTPLSVSAEQVETISRLIGPSARPLQQRQERDILSIN